MLFYGVGAAYADFMDNAFFSLVNDVHSNEPNALVKGRPEVVCVVRWQRFLSLFLSEKARHRYWNAAISICFGSGLT